MISAWVTNCSCHQIKFFQFSVNISYKNYLQIVFYILKILNPTFNISKHHFLVVLETVRNMRASDCLEMFMHVL